MAGADQDGFCKPMSAGRDLGMNKSDKGGKRVLEPIHTPGYVHVPHLRKKLRWLYGYHPFINAQYKLAQAMHVAPATLSTWLNGTQYDDPHTVAPANPDSIPTRHFRSFVDIWGLPQAVLEIADLTEFKNALASFEADRSAWEKLVRAVPDDDSIEVIANTNRGIVDPDDEADPGILQFDASDEILIRAANPGLPHGLMLLQDRFGWSCLRPNTRWKETKIGNYFVFPRQIENEPLRFARLDTVGGVHRVLIIFVAGSLPGGLLEILLTRPIDVGSLNHAATVFQNMLAAGPDHCRMLSRRFLVATG
jgi:hypothetical protein